MNERKWGLGLNRMKATDDKEIFTLRLLLLLCCVYVFALFYSHFFPASVIPYLKEGEKSDDDDYDDNNNNSWNIKCLNSIKSLNMIFIENCKVK